MRCVWVRFEQSLMPFTLQQTRAAATPQLTNRSYLPESCASGKFSNELGLADCKECQIYFDETYTSFAGADPDRLIAETRQQIRRDKR